MGSTWGQPGVSLGWSREQSRVDMHLPTRSQKYTLPSSDPLTTCASPAVRHESTLKLSLVWPRGRVAENMHST
jgi:hypothetical protein